MSSDNIRNMPSKYKRSINKIRGLKVDPRKQKKDSSQQTQAS